MAMERIGNQCFDLVGFFLVVVVFLHYKTPKHLTA